jgi:hypothetical protein
VVAIPWGSAPPPPRSAALADAVLAAYAIKGRIQASVT